MIRRRLLVSGRVQGVFYRDTCRSEAGAAGVAGSARNLPDGRVEVVLEGHQQSVERVIDWCWKGTPGSSVEDIAISKEEPQGLDSFRIL